ncbi:hypothetical protein LSCM1_06315 [Leishmania martiniquensis]|uniref:PDZ domain-containing protein n=1 Tax=Leishmania martiniquensis TaxID=1580590 RepID=A0A836HMA3_9TRYP|nr:hypothetical protein LSCM1_06315 [Leishmania martiniquensis]
MASPTQLVPHIKRDGPELNLPYRPLGGEFFDSKLSTLRGLRDFYEQHSFDTQGPYADLFAVLLSSCKHLIDINVELVHHIKLQGDTQQRQQLVCDALCGNVARHRTDIENLRASLGHLTSRDASRQAAATNSEDDDSSLWSGAAASPHACLKKETTAVGYAQRIGEERPAALPAPQHRAGTAASPHAPAADFQRASLSTPSASRVEPGAHKYATTPSHREVPPSEPMGALPHPSPSQHAAEGEWAAGLTRRTNTMQSQPANPLAEGCLPSAQLDEEQKQQQSSAVLPASLAARRQHAKDGVDRRHEHLTRHLAAVEASVHEPQRRLQWIWEGGDLDSSHLSASPATASRIASGSEFTDPYTATAGHAPSNPQQELTQGRGASVTSPISARTPPAILVRWIDSRLQQWEAEWRRVLEDVQEALLLDAAVGARAAHPTSHAAAEGEAQVNRRAPWEGVSAVDQPTDAVTTPSCRGELVCALRALLCTHSAELYKRAVVESTRHVQRTDDELHDVRARLEALELYAPHRYAVTARPPLLGVELEDVLEPRIGVRLRTVYHGYLADRAGLSVGDVLVAVGRQSIQTRAQLYAVLGELTHEYNAQCRLQIEAGFMRSFTLGDGCCASDGRFVKCASPYHEAGVERKGTDSLLDQELQRVRSEAAAAVAGGTNTSGARSSAGRICGHSSLRGNAAGAGLPAAASPSLPVSPSVAEHKEQLAQCLPYFELCLHVVRDGRLRDVTLLIPPSDALRSTVY